MYSRDYSSTMAHSYDVGTRAWQPDPTEGWIASEVQEKKILGGGKVTLVFALANDEVRHLDHPDTSMYCMRADLSAGNR